MQQYRVIFCYILFILFYSILYSLTKKLFLSDIQEYNW